MHGIEFDNIKIICNYAGNCERSMVQLIRFLKGIKAS